MNHISCPAILVECGFLSNPAEEKLLLRDDYQRKIAATLAGTILTFSTPITTLQETLS
jgi:N-acetylmuramoyl-L-alanine amidase